jgi:hypothetical protein
LGFLLSLVTGCFLVFFFFEFFFFFAASTSVFDLAAVVSSSEEVAVGGDSGGDALSDEPAKSSLDSGGSSFVMTGNVVLSEMYR